MSNLSPRQKRLVLAGLAMLLAVGVGAWRKYAPARVQFEMVPAVVSACQQPVAVQVRWDATALGIQEVRAEVNNIGSQPKLWFIGPASGTETTGAWAQDGFTVTWKTMDGIELGKRTLTTTACPGIDWL